MAPSILVSPKRRCSRVSAIHSCYFRVVSTSTTELWWNKEVDKKKKNNKKNKNNLRFCHFLVWYLAGVVDAH